jgi:hypothetical protein
MMIKQFAEALMSAEADPICGTGYRERSAGRRTVEMGICGTGTPRREHRASHPELRSDSYSA